MAAPEHGEGSDAVFVIPGRVIVIPLGRGTGLPVGVAIDGCANLEAAHNLVVGATTCRGSLVVASPGGRVRIRQVAVIPGGCRANAEFQRIGAALGVGTREGERAAGINSGDGDAIVAGVVGESGVRRVLFPGPPADAPVAQVPGQVVKEIDVPDLHVVQGDGDGRAGARTALLDDADGLPAVVGGGKAGVRGPCAEVGHGGGIEN